MSTRSASNIIRRILTILGIVVLFILIAYFSIGAFAVGQLTQAGNSLEYAETPLSYGVDFEEVTLPAQTDMLQIAAWYLPNPSSDRAIILVHGKDTNKQAAETGAIVALEVDLYRAGYTVLAIDLRAHGDSEGERFSFGVLERRDVLGAVDFLRSEGFASGKIGVLGISMGGGAVIGAYAESLDIGALVVESGFSDILPIIQQQWEKESGLPNYFLPGVFLMNRLLYGYDLALVRPSDELAAADPRPVFIIHCREDSLIDLAQAEQLISAAPQAQSWVMDNCEHAEIYRDYPEEYANRVIEFFDTNL